MCNSITAGNENMVAPTTIERLRLITTRQELAALLNLKSHFLTNILYRNGVNTQYSQFRIPKKDGSFRLISSPSSKLKDIQKRLAELLYECQANIHFERKINPVLSHGFEKNKTIVTNATRHRNKRILLNIDLENFFESINFGRVRGFFIANNDFKLSPLIATTLAQIACFNNSLPQGSPCSPIISNLICTILDIRLSKLAQKNGCQYSRYADDITFSTNKKEFPQELVIDNDVVNVGAVLLKEIERAGFRINHRKTRLLYSTSRQEVTGLTVNKKVNVDNRYYKKVRAMAHTLYKDQSFSIIKENAKPQKGTLNQLEGMMSFIDSIDKYNNKLKLANKQPQKYQSFNYGLNYEGKLNRREKTLSKFLYYKYFHGLHLPTILVEGKTDRVYLKCALRSLFLTYPTLVKKNNATGNINYSLNFFRESTRTSYFLDISGGAAEFEKFITRYPEQYKRFNHTPLYPVIMILDNDSGTRTIVRKISKTLGVTEDSIKKNSFTHILHNLYIVLTPLLPGDRDSCMEDLFDSSVLSAVIDGRSFDKSNNYNKNTHYGKNDFSLKVIKVNEKNINFLGFLPVLNAVRDCLVHYNNIPK